MQLGKEDDPTVGKMEEIEPLTLGPRAILMCVTKLRDIFLNRLHCVVLLFGLHIRRNVQGKHSRSKVVPQVKTNKLN